MPAEIREVSFPLALRGYSTRVVDAYVERVNRVIAQLEADRSPRSAVRHALDRVGDQVGGILEHARVAAEQITKTARDEADEMTARAKAEAAELVVAAGAAADRDRAEAQATLARARAAAEAVVAQAKEELAALEAAGRGADGRDPRRHGRGSGASACGCSTARARRRPSSRRWRPRPPSGSRAPTPADAPTEPMPEQAAVVAVEPGDVSAKRKSRAAVDVTRLPTKSRAGTPRAS